MAEPHQHPYSLQPPPPQQHQSMPPWYGMPPGGYHPQQAPALPPPHHAMPWNAAALPPPPPPGEQGYNYVSQPYHVPPQGDFYSRSQQVHHHYPPPPQPAQPQFTYVYGQQDQVWQQANNSWGYQQWPHPAQTGSLSQEEVWAAKARAWAASKAVQEESRPNPNTPQQMHQDCMLQPQEQLPMGQQHSLQPPGQEIASIHSYQNNSINQGQSAQLRGQTENPPQTLAYSQPTQDATSSITPESALESYEKMAQAGGQLHANDSSHSMFSSSQVHDAASTYGLDNSMTGVHGNERQPLPKKLPSAPVFPQQATHLLPQSQASPLISQPHLPFSDKFSTAGYEQQQQQMPPHYLHPPPPPPPPPPPNPQQPPSHVPHQPQKLPLQSHYQASGALEGVEGEFGLSPPPGALQSWAPVGGPGMPFPPAMGAGTSQFDPIHTPHQLPLPWRPDGSGLQGLGFPNGSPFAVGTSPGLATGAGPPVRPLFAPDSFVERPKKAAVPSWLREELIKKKAAGVTSGMLSSDESGRVNGGEPANSLGQRVGISDKLRSSSPGLSEDEEEDQEEEIEAARSAAINQEIKRLLTEVLLKVTGDLFEEIAQEVLNEDSDDILGGTSSPDERVSVGRPASPSSPDVGPPPSGRVLVSSGKNPAPDDNGREKESSDSGEAAGDVLGLGNYASDDETLDPKDNEAPHSLSFETDLVTIDAKLEESGNDHHTDGPSQSIEPLHQVKGLYELDTVQATSVKQESAYHVDVQNGRSPTRGDLGTSQSPVRKSSSKGITDQSQLVSEPSSSKGRSNLMLKMEDKSQDTLVRSAPGKERAGRSSSDTSFKQLDNKMSSFSQDALSKNRKKEEKREDKPKDLSSKERKREDKSAVEPKSREERDDRSKAKSDTSNKERHVGDRTKDNREVKRPRGSESRNRDSSRERRKEKDKVKEKLKPRERESDRDRKKQEKREREGRSKRGEAVEKKVRHRSASSSSSPGREGSSSSNSDRSRGKLHTRRSSRHHTSTSSPGRSRKRRASRSRSRSRSPHVKHIHRRNVPSPSHEKSRRSGSKSPVHRRGRG